MGCCYLLHTPTDKAGLRPEHSHRNPPYPLTFRKNGKTAFYIDGAFFLDFRRKNVRYLSQPSAPRRFASDNQRATLAATWLWSQVWKGETVLVYVSLFFPPCCQCSSGPDHILHYGLWTLRISVGRELVICHVRVPTNSGTSRIIVIWRRKRTKSAEEQFIKT